MKLSNLLLIAAVFTASVVFASGERGSPAAVDNDVGLVQVEQVSAVLSVDQVMPEAVFAIGDHAEASPILVFGDISYFAEPMAEKRWRCPCIQDVYLPSALKPPAREPNDGRSSDGACGTI